MRGVTTPRRHCASAGSSDRGGEYPHETRLVQIREALHRDLEQAQGRQARPRDLEEIRRLQAELEKTQDPATSRRLGERMLALGAKYPNDPDFDSALVYVQRRAVQRPQAANSPHDETEEQGATQMFFRQRPEEQTIALFPHR